MSIKRNMSTIYNEADNFFWQNSAILFGKALSAIESVLRCPLVLYIWIQKTPVSLASAGQQPKLVQLQDPSGRN